MPAVKISRKKTPCLTAVNLVDGEMPGGENFKKKVAVINAAESCSTVKVPAVKISKKKSPCLTTVNLVRR